MKPPKGEPICYLCGILIDAGMVNLSHPLFGTIDHIIPVSLGGPDKGWNRLPTHRICNFTKDNLMPTNSLMEKCRKIISTTPGSKRLVEGMTKANRRRVAAFRLFATEAVAKFSGGPQ